MWKPSGSLHVFCSLCRNHAPPGLDRVRGPCHKTSEEAIIFVILDFAEVLPPGTSVLARRYWRWFKSGLASHSVLKNQQICDVKFHVEMSSLTVCIYCQHTWGPTSIIDRSTRSGDKYSLGRHVSRGSSDCLIRYTCSRLPPITMCQVPPWSPGLKDLMNCNLWLSVSELIGCHVPDDFMQIVLRHSVLRNTISRLIVASWSPHSRTGAKTHANCGPKWLNKENMDNSSFQCRLSLF